MKIERTVIGAIGSNCYLVTDEKSGESAVIDPGRYKQALKELLISAGVEKLKYIILTHGHYDHVMGVPELKKDYGGQVCIHRLDAECLEDPEAALAKYSIARHFIPSKADVLPEDGDSLYLGETELHVLHTPGHSPGSICLLAEDTMFSGDTLFAGTVGRLDLDRSVPEQMPQTIGKLKKLTVDYRVLPGHGESTTLFFEQCFNPFFI